MPKLESTGEGSADEDQGEGPVSVDKGQQPLTAAPSRVERGEGPSQPASIQDDTSDVDVIINSLSIKDLRNLRKDFTRHDGEPLLSWLA
ncbi:hypothetical protein llap_62 [Limosa lapponica baueri]|uniref:Uncharacterized protein n=1 Tax=Limosa lapponica baueri TaxID=1758121 RepID=A0A2I0UUI4_LIMLA|nr:hypothetical protein llap_62 [Limosa lapponica baueri]